MPGEHISAPAHKGTREVVVEEEEEKHTKDEIEIVEKKNRKA